MVSGRLKQSLQLIPGLLIVALGALLLLDNLEIYDLGNLKDWWPLLVVVFGVHLIVQGDRRGLGITVAVIGAALQLSELGVMDLNWGTLGKYWPLLLIGVGGSMLVRPSRGNIAGGVIVLTLGAYFQAKALGWVEFELVDLWPVAVIAAGLGMLQNSNRPRG